MAQSNPPTTAELQAALNAGDVTRVEALVAAGADVRYRRDYDYDALIDAVSGRDVTRDPRLLELLALLVRNGAPLSGQSSYQESGLRILSRVGLFEAVRFLLAAGADERLLRWSPLIRATALGSTADMEAALRQGARLEDSDFWSRTAWLVAVQLGDLDKAEWLRERGANVAARGRCGQPPLFFAVESRRSEVVRYLLDLGADVESADEFGQTPLIHAVNCDAPEIVDVLLKAGADINADCNGTPLERVQSRAVALRLLEAGADPGKLRHEGRRLILGWGEVRSEPLDDLPEAEFRRAPSHRFGRTNPEPMPYAFWKAMLASGVNAYEARRRFDDGRPDGEPIWCADRFGQSMTLLPDGRAVLIGGEHEDFYDVDFCIYNDVVVQHANGDTTIYGYPESDFPPTDFHAAVPLGDSIYLLGGLGYQGRRRFGETPVYRLDLGSFRMERVPTTGDCPGWIFSHRAAALDAGRIRVWGGTIAALVDGTENHEPNTADFVLDLSTRTWKRS